MANRATYERKLAAQLREWEAHIEALRAKAQNATANARVGYESELERLEASRHAARELLTELGRQSGQAWDDMKGGTDRAWEELRKAVANMTRRFK